MINTQHVNLGLARTARATRYMYMCMFSCTCTVEGTRSGQNTTHMKIKKGELLGVAVHNLIVTTALRDKAGAPEQSLPTNQCTLLTEGGRYMKYETRLQKAKCDLRKAKCDFEKREMGNAICEKRFAKCKIARHANAKCAKSHMTKAKRVRPFSATVQITLLPFVVFGEGGLLKCLRAKTIAQIFSATCEM